MAIGLETLMRFGYALVLVTVGLMIWASSVGAVRITDKNSKDPPCIFNPSCTCSSSSPENLGNVQCHNVAFSSMPDAINISKVYALRLDNTGLMEIEPYFLQASGLYRIDISRNPIHEIPDEAFAGLERSLWELILKYDGLIEIPTKAMRYLQKLRFLDLSGNDISTIERNSFRNLQNSLTNLILADNSISQLSIEAFQGLPFLESLDLSSNNLHEILPDVFREQMNSLVRVNFADNVLKEIPYLAFSMLKVLRVVDLSSNRITGLQMEHENKVPLNVKLTLDTLHLEHNQIGVIPPGSFMYFLTANQTFLDFNPLRMISEKAFQNAKIRELFIRHCKLDHIDPNAFNGLESSLQVLDISGNNITALPDQLFSSFDLLRHLNVKDNKIYSIFPQGIAFPGFQYSLFKLDLSGNRNGPTNLQDLRKMKSLRSLSVGRLVSTQLSPEDFNDFGVELENLKIIHAGLQGIKAHAFMNVRGIKRLDLSENSIGSIDKGAFQEIGHSLVSLKIAHGFAGQFNQFPDLKDLTQLEELDFSNNKIKSIGDTAFHALKNLRILELNDNQLDSIHKGTFQRDIHHQLEEIEMEFNQLRHINTHTFVDIAKLHTIRLRDNKIERLERRAFMNLEKLKLLSLRGNKLSSISDESFQNLPELTNLDMAYNSLKSFDFDFFDQVGTLSYLRVNVSHNRISELNDNMTSFTQNREQGSSIYHSNIRVLDLSHNNISRISAGYFKPAEISLASLSLAYNRLTNTSREIFGNLMHLQLLDLSNNFIEYIAPDTFRNARKLQILNLAQNELTEISYDSFRNVGDLRIVDFSFNMLRTLPDSLFASDDLEKLDVSHNQLTKIPVSSLTNLAALSICDLDLSHNNIGAIHSMDLSNKFRRLSKLDLSHNRLVRLEDAAFATLPSLSILDLSDNDELELYGRVFIGLEKNLIELYLDNISIIQAPDLNLPNLRVLTLAQNELPSIPPELAANLTSIRELDLSHNDLTAVPLITHSLPNLRSLSLAANPITSLTNTSLLGAAETLETLDISHLELTTIEQGILNKYSSLRTLRLSTYPGLINFNIPTILDDVENLRNLWIDSPAPKMVKFVSKEGVESYELVQEAASDLRVELYGALPPKLKNLTISGAGFNRLADNILQGIQSPAIHLTLFNTTLSGLPENMFQNIDIYNISIEIDSNNKKLTSIPNPNSAEYPNMPDSVLLTDLRIQYTTLACDCEIGWVEFWQRKKRQYLCSQQKWSDDGTAIRSVHHTPENCDDPFDDDDLRTVRCSNKNAEPLLEVLKNELECGWSGSTRLSQMNIIVLILFPILLITFII